MDDEKTLPSPLHAIQATAIEAAKLMLEAPDTPAAVKKDLIESVFDRTGLQIPTSAPVKSNGVSMEVFGTALQALASQIGVDPGAPIELKGVTVEEIPVRKAKKAGHKASQERRQLLETISESDSEDA